LRRSGVVRAVDPGPPMILDLEAAGTIHRIAIPHRGDALRLASLCRELLGQTVEFTGDTVWFFRTVEEDGEVESVYRVCLNTEIARLKPPQDSDAHRHGTR
jgi:hypothetical protein